MSTGKTYLEQFASDSVAQRALLACAAALRLDDESAKGAIEIVAQANGRTRELLHAIKNLGCVWRQWDGSWYLSEDVRKELVDQLYKQVPKEQITKLRSHLAEKADHRATAMLPDGQITAHRLRTALFEAGFQRIFIPGQAKEGGEQLSNVWEMATPSAGEATARSVDYLASEIEVHVGRLPVQVLFLRGMAARARRDRVDQERYFRAVWEQGTKGHIFAMAAHFFGNLVKNRSIAERAFQDSIAWKGSPIHRGHVLHSLGNLLATDFRRRRDAEDAYHESLELDPSAFHAGQVWHSLGNLLAKDRQRSREAEKAYKKSLDQLQSATDRAQVWHSFGNLLAKDRQRSREAEEAYKKSLDQLQSATDRAQVWHSLGNLLSKDQSRVLEAEDAYQKSLDLRHDAPHQAQVLASLASHLSTLHNVEVDVRAELFAQRSLALARDLKTNGICYRVLADVYERRGDNLSAINALESLMETDRHLRERKFEQSIRNRIAKLRRSEHRDTDSGHPGNGATGA